MLVDFVPLHKTTAPFAKIPATIILMIKKALELTRYAVVIPAVAAILGALLLMVQGSIEMIVVILDAIFEATSLKQSIVDVLTAVDAILLGTVLLVIGYGLYELFIDTEIKVPAWLRLMI